MTRYNCILVFDMSREHILFCRRVKPPYAGLLNLVGGKVEAGERSIVAAYRELFEETGIRKEQIRLTRLMDMVYYNTNIKLEVFAGILKTDVELVEEFQRLEWRSRQEDFFDSKIYAGDGNIGHIVEQVKL